ncbi:LysE family translocator [Congregibacter litoralis]|uniref:Putative threonine efflux protein n=1 Tax=Congregibacter litoralis KT71 TaxID=314285 RepID=A4A7R9_9GAMM|nr:LysE family translocator [Congregibacter litoralis]EAQ97714.1 putative threonine efflux protein [Congregibacter litoralis KT71]
MTFWVWLSLSGLCLAGAASPGPSLAVVISASLGGGRARGLAAAWAHALGVGLYAALTVFGLSAIIATSDRLFVALQTLGALYLLWLALGLWRSADAAPTQEDGTAGARTAARDGFAIAFLNPKLAVFMLALFSQFVHPEASGATQAAMVLTAFFVDGLWYTVITLAVTRENWVRRLRSHAGTIDRIFAVLLTLVAIAILARVIIEL